MTGLRLDSKGELAVLRMDKPRGNAIDEALIQALLEAARELSKDDGVRGVLLASAHPKLFCPGLDLVSLLDYDRPALQRFMTAFGEAMMALYALRQPMVAAISGHAVAGGAILALTADDRVLRKGGAQIGLNEVKIGVPLPWSVSVLLRATVGARALPRVALLGRNFADEEALAVGLVDALADAEGFEDFCLARLAEFAEKDRYAFGATKTYLRAGVLAEMRAREAELLPEFLDAWYSVTTQSRIRQMVASLQGRA
jgi:enoyl-CoA hydratase/carnithine racemase